MTATAPSLTPATVIPAVGFVPHGRQEGVSLDWWHDPANADPRFTRTRVRDTVLPVLEAELGPGVAAALARTADLLRLDVEHLDGLADAAYAGLSEPLAVEDLLALAPAVRTRVLRLAALRAGARDAELFHDHVRALDALLTDWHGQGPVDLPGHLRGARREGVLIFEQT